MTEDEFVTQFWPRMCHYISEAWCARKEGPSAMGLLMDQHHILAKGLMREMYRSLQDPKAIEAAKPATNGVPRLAAPNGIPQPQRKA